MTEYGTPARGSVRASNRERTLSYVAGLLGLLMFAFGFLKWLKIGTGHDAEKYAGYAFGMPTTAVILTSLAAGVIAVLGATDRRDGRGVPNAVPAGLALTSLLGAIGILIAKGSISPDVGDKVGVEVGLILGLIVAALQTLVLLAEHASRSTDEANTGYAPTRAAGPGTTAGL